MVSSNTLKIERCTISSASASAPTESSSREATSASTVISTSTAVASSGRTTTASAVISTSTTEAPAGAATSTATATTAHLRALAELRELLARGDADGCLAARRRFGEGDELIREFRRHIEHGCLVVHAQRQTTKL